VRTEFQGVSLSPISLSHTHTHVHSLVVVFQYRLTLAAENKCNWIRKEQIAIGVDEEEK
jgi:hypothetical protein